MLSGTFANRKDFILGGLSVVRSWRGFLTQRRRDAEYAERFRGVSSQESGVGVQSWSWRVECIFFYTFCTAESFSALTSNLSVKSLDT